MNYPQIIFQVRINDSTNLKELGARITKCLNLQFLPVNTEDGEVLQANILGLSINLICNSNLLPGKTQNYCLMGSVRDDLEAKWDLDSSFIDISSYILGILLVDDQNGWYIPNIEELEREAGLF